MTINQTVHNYANTRVGTQVGNGECFTLADLALRQAGAKSASDYGRITSVADYQWGNVVNIGAAIRGDIIQFRNYRVTVTTITVTRTDTRGGGFSEDTNTQIETQSRGHHTAIVDSISANGVISVLEQNVGTGVNRRKVQRNMLYFQSYSAPARVARRGNTTTTVNQKIEVRGRSWFYRPQPPTINQGR